MKKLQFLLLVILFMGLNAQSQVTVTFGKPPVWAPAKPADVQYYYLPDVDTYYDVPSSKFIYQRNGKWFRSAALPAQYRNYNLKGGNVVYLTDYKGNEPYKFHKDHMMKYPKHMKKMKKNDAENYHDNDNTKQRDDHHDNDNDNEREHGNGKGHGKGHGKGDNHETERGKEEK
ncbi:MAG: hypothetical protein H7239_09480 [Flavobacterium sp.]|nr:hypothetical protein [Flavobacterium sp.]